MSKPGPSLVYFVKPVGMDGPIKIGCTTYPKERLTILAAWSPVALEFVATVPGDTQLERNIHRCFADAHIHHEWFHPVPGLLSGIDALKRGLPVSEAFDLSAIKGEMPTRQRKYTWPPEKRLAFGWKMRVLHAERAAAKFHGSPRWAPDDVDVLLADIARGKAFPLSGEQLTRLKELVSEPFSHMLTRDQKWPPKVAA